MVTIIKIIFLLGFLIFIHEFGHFIVAKKHGVTVNEFSIGFGPTIFSKVKNKTKYEIRIIPLGGFVSLEGEEEHSENEGSFSKQKPSVRFKVLVAGGLVNIAFGLILFLVLILVRYMLIKNVNFLEAFTYSIKATGIVFIEYIKAFLSIFVGKVSLNDMTGPIGISKMVSETSKLSEFLYLLSTISISLGFTNLLPIVPLDGGKAVLTVIEAIRKKPFKDETIEKISQIGFALIFTLFIICTYNDLTNIKM